MNLLHSLLVVAGVTAVTVTSMLLVRRRAPAGSFFSDGDRASGVFGVLATGFSVLLGFIIFLAFQAYDDTRAGAETEAAVVFQMVQTAQLMPAGSSKELTGELVCYGRSVVGTEWDAVARGGDQDSINPWGAKMFITVAALQPKTSTEQSAYDRWMEQTAGPAAGPQRPGAHRAGHHPRAAVVGAVPHLRGDLRLPAVLRRQRRAGPDPGGAHGQRHAWSSRCSCCSSASSTTRTVTASAS